MAEQKYVVKLASGEWLDSFGDPVRRLAGAWKVGRSTAYRRASECYEHVPCELLCAVEPDLTLDDGTLRGSFHTCDECSEAFHTCDECSEGAR